MARRSILVGRRKRVRIPIERLDKRGNRKPSLLSIKRIDFY
jgi:hypothetical protein